MKKINMPNGAKFIIEELNKKGYEAYIVGGCVRDSLLEKTPNDWDITTSATPYQVKELFRRTIDTGIQHGTVTVLVDKAVSNGGEYAFEVTTYRIDGVYEDHRRPKEVEFTASLEEDLKRRDFTINAMAYNDTEGVIDIFGGQEDLKNGIVRCVGTPSHRFDEDALRILRAVRFAAQLGFDIDQDTKDAMTKQAKFLSDISAERIQVELSKLITSDNPGMLVEAYELGLTEIILPEFDQMMETTQNNPHHLYNVGEHTIKVMENVPPTPIMRYAALLHDVAKPVTKTTDQAGVDHFYEHQSEGSKLAKKILSRLKLDNNTINQVTKLVLYHDYGMSADLSIKAFRRFLGKIGVEYFNDFITLRKADTEGQSSYNLAQKKASIAHMEQMYDIVIKENQCLNISELKIGGKELIALGMKPSQEMGNMLREILEMVLDEPGLNNKETLTKIVTEKINNKNK